MEQRRIKFTKTTIEGLPSPQEKTSRVDYYDTEQPHLSLRVTGNGAKTFTVRRKVRGSFVRVTLGRFPVLSVEQARALAKNINYSIAAGENPNAKKRLERGALRFEDLWSDYMETHAKPHKKTWREDERFYRLYLSSWAKKRVSEISHEMVNRLHKTVGKDNGQRTANILLQILATVFTRANIEPNPCKGVTRFVERSRERTLEPEEAAPLFREILQYEDPTVRDFLLVLIFTGRRKGEILSLKWSQVKFDRGVIELGITKNGEKQTAFITSPVVRVLQSRVGNGSDYVFPNNRSNSKTPHLLDPKKAWATILKNSGIKDLVMHDLRSVLTSLAAQKGIGDFLIQKMTQHKTTRALRVYQRMRDHAPALELAEEMGKQLLEMAKVPMGGDHEQS